MLGVSLPCWEDWSMSVGAVLKERKEHTSSIYCAVQPFSHSVSILALRLYDDWMKNNQPDKKKERKKETQSSIPPS